jgi:hypothetical protein
LPDIERAAHRASFSRPLLVRSRSGFHRVGEIAEVVEASSEQLVLDAPERTGVFKPADRIHLEIEAREPITLHQNDAVAHHLPTQHRRRGPEIEDVDSNPVRRNTAEALGEEGLAAQIDTLVGENRHVDVRSCCVLAAGCGSKQVRYLHRRILGQSGPKRVDTTVLHRR